MVQCLLVKFLNVKMEEENNKKDVEGKDVFSDFSEKVENSDLQEVVEENSVDKNVSVEDDTNKSFFKKFSSFLSSHFWVIFIFAIFVILGSVGFMLLSYVGFFSDKFVNNSSNGNMSVTPYDGERTNVSVFLMEEESLEESIKVCMEKDVLDIDCEMLFMNRNIEAVCERLGDRCFYFVALTHLDSRYCARIVDVNLREKCENDSFVRETGSEVVVDTRNEVSISDEEKQRNFLAECLKQDVLSIDCQLAFTDDNIMFYCTGLGDDCFYLAATRNSNAMYCNKIVDAELKENCLLSTQGPEDFVETSEGGTPEYAEWVE